MKMASTLMSIVKLCLRRYRYRFAEDAISWILGPRAKEHYLKVPPASNKSMIGRLVILRRSFVACVRMRSAGTDCGRFAVTKIIRVSHLALSRTFFHLFSCFFIICRFHHDQSIAYDPHVSIQLSSCIRVVSFVSLAIKTLHRR